MKSIKYLLILSLIIILDGCKPPPPPAPSVQGIVIKTIDSITKKPLEGITVAITAANLNDSKNTASDGICRWEGAGIGEYIITVSSNDYKAQKKVVTVAVGKPSENTFSMELAPMLEVNPASLNFSIDKKSEKVYFKNKSATGDITLNIEGFEDWLTVNPSSLTIPARQQKEVTFSVDTKGLSYGQKSTKIILNYRLNNVSDNTDFTAQFNYSNPEDPVVETNTPTGITRNSADISGSVIKLNGSTIVQKGICWSENLLPNAASDPTATISGGGLGAYTLTANNLKEGKTYNARAFVRTTSSTAPIYGNTVEFTTSITPTPPTVILNPITNIGQTNATLSGKVSNNGGSGITEQGFCYNTKGNPKINDDKLPANVDANGNFTVNMSGLNQGLVYYIKAYAINGLGATNAGYSNEIFFKTQVPTTPPQLATSTPNLIFENSANVQGSVSDLGSTTIVEHGFCYSDKTNQLNISNSTILNLGPKNNIGLFDGEIKDLKKGTVYYLRCFAKNNNGEYFYGNTISFATKQLGLVALYSFDNNINDLSGNGNNGKNTMGFTSNKFNNLNSALNLSSGFFEASNLNLFNYKGNLTVSFLLKNNSSLFSDGKKVLFSKTNGYCDERTDGYQSRADGFIFYFSNSSLNLKVVNQENRIEEVSLINKEQFSNDWNHVAIVKNDKSLRVYLNGLLTFQTQTNLETRGEYNFLGSVSIGAFMIGKVDASGCNYANPPAIIDNLKILNIAASANDILKDSQ